MKGHGVFPCLPRPMLGAKVETDNAGGGTSFFTLGSIHLVHSRRQSLCPGTPQQTPHIDDLARPHVHFETGRFAKMVYNLHCVLPGGHLRL